MKDMRGSSIGDTGNPLHTEMTDLSKDDMKDVPMDEYDEDDDLIPESEDFTNVTAEQGEVELGSYALPKKPRSLHNNDLREYTTLPAPPSRTDYSAHGHMASKTLRSRLGYTVALLKCVGGALILSPNGGSRAGGGSSMDKSNILTCRACAARCSHTLHVSRAQHGPVVAAVAEGDPDLALDGRGGLQHLPQEHHGRDDLAAAHRRA